MNLDIFKTVVAKQGLAKNFNWECRIYPPPDLAKINDIFDFDVGKGFTISANLPGIDMLDNAIEKFNNLTFDLPGISFGHNTKLPTLGYSLRNTGGFIDRLNLYCNMCSFPERDVQNVAWKDTAGEERQLGIMHNHSRGMSLSYYCSEDLRERLFFEKWQDTIFNPLNKRRSFYKNYIGNMEVIKYDSAWKEQIAIYKFNEAYPSNIASQTLSFEGASLLRLDVQFKYRNYERIK